MRRIERGQGDGLSVTGTSEPKRWRRVVCLRTRPQPQRISLALSPPSAVSLPLSLCPALLSSARNVARFSQPRQSVTPSPPILSLIPPSLTPSPLPPVFALLARHRDGHSFATGSTDGFQRYHQHLSRALQATRKSLGVKGNGQVDTAKIADQAACVALPLLGRLVLLLLPLGPRLTGSCAPSSPSSSRAVPLLLLSAERAYIVSLSTAATPHTSKTPKQHALARLSKASAHLAALAALPTIANSPIAAAQTAVFQLLVTSSRALKQGTADDRALEGFALGLSLVRALEAKLPAEASARAAEWAQRDFLPAIRYCAYRLRSETAGVPQSVDAVLAAVEPRSAELAKSFAVDPAVFSAVDSLPAPTPEEVDGRTLVWLGNTISVPSARLVGALALVQAERRKLAVVLSFPRRKGLLKAFDRVLAAVDRASAIAPSSAAGGEADGDDAALVGDYLAFVRADTVIRRDLHLVYHVSPPTLRSPSGPSSSAVLEGAKAEEDAKATAKTVRLLGSVVGQLEGVGALGAVERGAHGEADAVELKVGWFRALRCVLLFPPSPTRAQNNAQHADPHPPRPTTQARPPHPPLPLVLPRRARQGPRPPPPPVPPPPTPLGSPARPRPARTDLLRRAGGLARGGGRPGKAVCARRRAG